MSVRFLKLTPRDPIVARDSRPFGAGQGNRMRSLNWPWPSVVAGSFRTALVKSAGMDFTRNTPVELLRVEVAGVFPAVQDVLYLPAPNDCVWERGQGVHRVQPVPFEVGEGSDLPHAELCPVRLSERQAAMDFKPEMPPAWWPTARVVEWLISPADHYPESWLEGDPPFLQPPVRDARDHVCLDAERGAAAESLIYSTIGLNVSRLPRFSAKDELPWFKQFTEVSLTARVTCAAAVEEHVSALNLWHPLGGERRMVHWRDDVEAERWWQCPQELTEALDAANRVRMLLTTPAIFDHGWRPDWLDPATLTGKPLGDGPTLRLRGVCLPRWAAVSGWAYAPHAEDGERRRVVPKQQPGPKAIRRMVPAGSVYFFERVDGPTRVLATNGWLKPVSDAPHDCRDGFGLAVWGIW
ncbi:type III-B CRISPR module-associated Cmr3 family protein [Thermopirellula anaerolimosa]